MGIVGAYDFGSEDQDEAIGIDGDLLEELQSREKWAQYSGPADEGQPDIGDYTEVLENPMLQVSLRKPDGRIEQSLCYLGKHNGQPRTLHLFEGIPDLGDNVLPVIADFKKISSTCPFAVSLGDVFEENGCLCVAYELDGGAVSMHSALQNSITSGGLLTRTKGTEEELMESWLGQLLWTVHFVHAEMNWFIGSSLLWSPQNILLTSQYQRIQLAGLGLPQFLALSRSPLPYSPNEIRSQQMQDLFALSDLVKSFLTGPRRWLVRSPLIAPILSYLDQRGIEPPSTPNLVNLPASQVLLKRIFVRSIRYNLISPND